MYRLGILPICFYDGGFFQEWIGCTTWISMYMTCHFLGRNVTRHARENVISMDYLSFGRYWKDVDEDTVQLQQVFPWKRTT